MFPFQLCVFLSFQPSIFPGVVSFSPGGVRHPSSQGFLFLEPFIQASFFVEAKRSLEKLLKLFKARCVFIIENQWKSKVFFKPQTWEQCFWKCWWWKKQCITCDVMKLWNRHECGIYINILIYYIYIYQFVLLNSTFLCFPETTGAGHFPKWKPSIMCESSLTAVTWESY